MTLPADTAGIPRTVRAVAKLRRHLVDCIKDLWAIDEKLRKIAVWR